MGAATTAKTFNWKLGDKVAIRDGYGRGLLEVGALHPEVVALDADLAGSTRSNWFEAQWPERFVQMGISEQDMVTTAGGLAHMGKTPFVSTFAVFLERGWEQIRNCVGRQGLNVKFCGSHGGLMTGQDGSSAHGLEDIGIMRTLPNMYVVSPADANEARSAVHAMYERKGPCYMRSTRAGVPMFHDDDYEFKWGKGQIVQDGEDVTLIASGPHVNESLQVAKQAKAEGISVRVVNMASIKPIDEALVSKCAHETGRIVTAEDHFIHNGLGSAVAEVMAEHATGGVLHRIGVRSFTTSGTPEELYQHFEVDQPKMLDAVRAVLTK